MSHTYRHGRVYCQVAGCRNRLTRTVKVALPPSSSEAVEDSARMLLVGVCPGCGRDLEARARTLLGTREEEGGARPTTAKALEGYRNMALLLVELLRAIGAPFEPHQGPYARWLARLDRPHAQIAWRVLAHLKRHARTGDGLAAAAVEPDYSPGDPAA